MDQGATNSLVRALQHHYNDAARAYDDLVRVSAECAPLTSSAVNVCSQASLVGTQTACRRRASTFIK